MAEAFAKFRVGTPGSGAAHASYITRASALEPNYDRDHGRQLDLNLDDVSVPAALDDHLNDRALDQTEDTSEADPVWTWNAPSHLTGDDHGIQQGNTGHLIDNIAGPDTPSKSKMTASSTSRSRAERLRDKVTNLRTYFGYKEQFEKAKGGRTHYRVILSFDVPATNEQIRGLTNQFLKDTFPKAIGFAAIHRDTDHPHAHVYLHACQIDGRKIYLSRDAYRTIDENWAKIYSQFAGDRSIYVQHLRKKEETQQWKIAAAEAYRKGEPIPPKPERDNDRRERLAEQRLSAQRSEARDRGKQLESRPKAEPVSRPASEKESSRLLAKTDIAQEQLSHLIRSDAPDTQIKSAARIAHEFMVALDKTLTVRKEMGRERAPQLVYTTEEWKQLKEYRTSRELPVRDDSVAGRLQAGRVLAGAELKDAQGKAEAFEASRHFWKFEVEGWDRRLSLKEVEQAIKTKAAEKLKLHNFLRPSKRETIQGQIDYLQDVKNDTQKQLAAKELGINRSLGAAEVRYQIASKQVEQAEKTRAAEGKGMPSAIHQKDELAKMDDIANRNTDAPLLRYVYEQVKDKLLSNPSPEALSRVKGCSVMAKLDMIKETGRLDAARRFGEFRQLPLRDARGLDYTKSVREVSPRNALETVIRHFSDSAEQKREQRELSDALRQQLTRAEDQYIKARDFSAAVDRILGDHCRAAGVSPRQVTPSLDSQQIAELREFAEKLPCLNTTRMEFTDAARQAERTLQEREATWSVGESQRVHTHDPSAHSREASPTQAASNTDRSDRNSYSRGR
jgi:Relaxase/Mobilisation nuclease domain